MAELSNAEKAWAGFIRLMEKATWDKDEPVREGRTGSQNAVIQAPRTSGNQPFNILGGAEIPDGNGDSNQYAEMLLNTVLGANTLGGIRDLMARQIFDWNPADVRDAGLHDKLVRMFDEREQSAKNNLALSMMSGFLSGNFMVDPTVMSEVTSSKMMKDKLLFEHDLLLTGTPKQQKAAAQFIGDMYLGTNYPQEKIQALGSLAAVAQAAPTETATRLNGISALASLNGETGLSTQDQIQLLNATGNFLGGLRNIKNEGEQKKYLEKLDEMVSAIHGRGNVAGAYQRSQNFVKPEKQ